MVNNLASSYGIDGNRNGLDIEVDEVLLPINANIPLGLIINDDNLQCHETRLSGTPARQH
ncbi:hypothetical protein [Porticoccus sp.]